MKANYSRKYEEPNSFLNLPNSEKRLINEYFNKVLNEEVDKSNAQFQRLMLKVTCCILHESFNWNEEEIMMFLGNWGREVRINRRDIAKKCVEQHLDERLSFMEWPTEFLENLEKI